MGVLAMDGSDAKNRNKVSPVDTLMFLLFRHCPRVDAANFGHLDIVTLFSFEIPLEMLAEILSACYLGNRYMQRAEQVLVWRIASREVQGDVALRPDCQCFRFGMVTSLDLDLLQCF